MHKRPDFKADMVVFAIAVFLLGIVFSVFVLEKDPDAFYITEQARDVSKVLKPLNQPITGWRAVLKMK